MPRFQLRRGALRLSHKIIAIGGAGVLGLMLVGGLYLSGSWSRAAYQNAATEARGVADTALRLSIQMLQARRAEKDFLLRNDDKSAKVHDGIVSVIATNFDAIMRRLEAAGWNGLLNQTRAARTDYDGYVKHFGALVASVHKVGLNENEGLQGTLRQAVHAIETAARGMKDVKLEAAMLMMRRHEKDFMLRRDPKYGEAMKRAATDFTGVLAGSAIQPEVKDDIAQKLAVYQRDFVAYMDGIQAIMTEQKALSEIYASFDPRIEAIVKDIEAIRDGIVAASEALDAATTMQIEISILAITVAVLLIAFFVGRAIGKPLTAMTAAMNELASGNVDVATPGLGRRDEIGEMAAAVGVFRDNLLGNRRMEAEKKEAELRVAAERKAAMHALADRFEKAVGIIVDAVSSASTELEAAADTLTKTAESTQAQSSVVAAASEQASANVQSVASATEEMAGSVDEISRQVQESNKIATEAVTQAELTDARISDLSQAAGRIGDVVKLISAVAEQTNLLALNATIEAARAGEAGRGFAIVAGEVKALAAQTSKATAEIGAQIAGMQSATRDSVIAIKAIGGIIARISQISTTIAAAVEEQGAATQEISRNVHEAAKGTAEVATNIGSVNRGAGETGAASLQVLSSARSLSSESSQLKLEMQTFLESVRAA
jgi:methyl-accepting chemotaxis protein